MTVDLAHASPQTIDDVLAIATKPVVVSHTGVRGACNNNRNISDAQASGVARTGGGVGIGFWETATCGTDALLAEGFNQEEIKQIMGGNVLRVFTENLPR